MPERDFKSSSEHLKPVALRILRTSELPLGVKDVARRLGVSWTTARHVLTELWAEGKIQTLKTSKSRVFFVERSQ